MLILPLFNRCLLILSVGWALTACMPNIHPAGTFVAPARLMNDAYITSDNRRLALKSWQMEESELKAVIIALHGFNDYSHFFQQPGRYFSQQQIISYAYDQRGFGESPNRGRWAGIKTYRDDLKSFISAVKQRHPELPIYLLGSSMGAAVVIATLAEYQQLPVAGSILVAPAIWTKATMPWYQNSLLWLLAHTTPWLTLTGSDLEIQASDNIDMLIALGKDPRVIKETRVEAIKGLSDLMDHAFSVASQLKGKSLLLYGEKDQVIPKQPTFQFLQQLKKNSAHQAKIALYPNGYHLLLRDLNAQQVWQDISAWINTDSAALPSGADKRAMFMDSGNGNCYSD